MELLCHYKKGGIVPPPRVPQNRASHQGVSNKGDDWPSEKPSKPDSTSCQLGHSVSDACLV